MGAHFGSRDTLEYELLVFVIVPLILLWNSSMACDTDPNFSRALFRQCCVNSHGVDEGWEPGIEAGADCFAIFKPSTAAAFGWGSAGLCESSMQIGCGLPGCRSDASARKNLRPR
jgi:hypothetical protein